MALGPKDAAMDTATLCIALFVLLILLIIGFIIHVAHVSKQERRRGQTGAPRRTADDRSRELEDQPWYQEERNRQSEREWKNAFDTVSQDNQDHGRRH